MTRYGQSVSWSSQDHLLEALWFEGREAEEIAEKLGRSSKAVLTRAVRIGLPRRKSAGRKPAASTALATVASSTVMNNSIPRILGFTPTEKVRRIVSNQNNNKQSETKKTVIIYQSRQCLMCNNSFPSEGAHNRICAKCKESQRYRNAG